MWNGWPCAHGVEPLPGSCGDRPPTSVACMDALVRMRCRAKCPMFVCHSAVLSARPVWVVFQDSIAVGRRNLSAVSSQWLFLVVYSSVRQLVTAERPAGAVGAIGRFATSTLLLAPPVNKALVRPCPQCMKSKMRKEEELEAFGVEARLREESGHGRLGGLQDTVSLHVLQKHFDDRRKTSRRGSFRPLVYTHTRYTKKIILLVWQSRRSRMPRG